MSEPKQPSPAAMRAAKAINTILDECFYGPPPPEEIAAIIDRETGVKELVEALKWSERELRGSTKSALTTIQSLRAENERLKAKIMEHGVLAQTYADSNALQQSEIARLRAALAHVQVCRECSEGDWNDCDQGRKAAEALK